jgi:DivIVA domain-containing protein
MPLTPEDVSNKRFTPVRLREGYDMGEVDQFLDEVESELERLHKENEDLRTKLSAAQHGDSDATTTTPVPAVAKEAEKKEEAQAPAPAAAPAPEPERIKITTAADASTAATRLLELATNNADQVVAEAKEEADRIVGAARTKAERLESETKTKTDRLEQDARSRAQMLDSETEAKRRELFGDLEKEKSRLDTEVENLRTFEREYRSRLKSYFTEQLAMLDGEGQGGQLPSSESEHTPKRLKSILGDDEQGDKAQG